MVAVEFVSTPKSIKSLYVLLCGTRGKAPLNSSGCPSQWDAEEDVDFGADRLT